jgi:hypothetical protein
MEGFPSPLRVGTPAAARRPSVDYHPALQSGSPVVERDTPSSFSRPPLTRRDTSGSDRLSQLFPSRPLSAASISPLDTPGSRRRSYPSPLLPAEPTYQAPRPPPPPSFSENTSYSPSHDQYDRQGPQHSLQSTSANRRLINRLTSLRSGRTKGAAYNKLEDEESGPAGKRLGGVEEIDEPVGYDLSGYEGLPMKMFEGKTMASAADAREQMQNMNEAGYAAEYERLEAQLGAGMNSIHEVPFTHHTGQPMQRSSTKKAGKIHRRAVSTDGGAADAAHADALKEAEKTGEILAVADIPMDLSEFGGADFETRSLAPGRGDNNVPVINYYFPPDPDMPAWRPFSMGWPWLSVLVTIALLLAIVQEVLCQLSMKSVDSDDKGGLKTFKKASELSVLEYFTWKYAPILLFVIYGILWQITDFEVKRLEPYYQLSKQTGATAAESLNMDYLTFMSWLVPLRALRHKQYAVIYSSVATLLASSLVPVLQSASVVMYPPQSQRKDGAEKYIRIDPPWSRAVSGILVLVAICGSILIYAMRRKSGLLSDPKGIAGVAAMATKSHILTDFRGLDTAPLAQIHKQLRHRRYILHKSALWQGEFIRNSTEKIHEHSTDPRPLMLRLRAGIPYICFIILFGISIPVFMFVEGADIVTEKLPFLLTALATVVKLLWGTMNCDVRMLEPYWILAQRRAPAKTLTLDYTGTNPLFLPLKAFLNKHYLVAFVGIGSILTEILTVCVSSFSVDGKKFIPGQGGKDFDDHDDRRRDNGMDGLDGSATDRSNTDETFRSFWISFALVIVILMVLVAIASLVYLRRSHKFMPRQVGTMASVLAFIHQSKMLVNFIDTEELDTNQMARHLSKGGKTYSLGWFSGRDGDDHCGIDEEPILAPYKYGEDWTQTRVLGNQIGSWENYE